MGGSCYFDGEHNVNSVELLSLNVLMDVKKSGRLIQSYGILLVFGRHSICIYCSNITIYGSRCIWTHGPIYDEIS
jgi:hypothetical protein